VYAYSDNYLIDLKHAVIVDVEATTAIRQAEVGAARTMLDRAAEQFDFAPSRLVADASYGSAEMPGWLVDERGIEPHVKAFDKSGRTDETFSRGDFDYDAECDLYVCPGGKELRKRRRLFSSLSSDAPETARARNVMERQLPPPYRLTRHRAGRFLQVEGEIGQQAGFLCFKTTSTRYDTRTLCE